MTFSGGDSSRSDEVRSGKMLSDFACWGAFMPPEVSGFSEGGLREGVDATSTTSSAEQEVV